jgi:ribulose-5-phosphate 4-epimerase/fuculose-1-phosphate aldolase
MCNSHASANSPISSLIADSGNQASRVDPQLIDDLVTANRILFAQGIVDAFGHASVRLADHPERFLLARNMAPGTVGSGDIVEFELDGTPVNAAGRSVAIVHSHSPTVLPFTVVQGVPFKPVCHMSGFLGKGAPVYEIRDHAGDASDLLIRSNALGVSLAEALGDASFVLMRGHGSTVVGPTLKHAVYRAVYAEVNARLQSEAMRLGPVNYLTAGEAETTCRNVETQIERPWNLWKSQLG